MKRYFQLEQTSVSIQSAISLKVLSVLLFLLLTIAAAHVRVPLPYTPVPFTLQVLAVFCAGYFLSRKLAVVCMMLYLAIGVIGFPVFSGGSGSFLSLAGPTSGYLIGFIPAAWVISSLSERTSMKMLNGLLTIISGIGIIYICGLAHLFMYVSLATGMTGLQAFLLSLQIGVFPFVLIDLVKGILAASIFYGLLRGKKIN